MTRYAPRCSHGSCTRPTRSATGRCFQHEGKSIAALTKTPSLPPALVLAGSTHISETDEFGVTTVLYQDSAGRPSRTDGPALSITNAKGEVIREEWMVEGVLHREDGPAKIEVKPRGDAVVEIEGYYHSGRRHRLDGPASTTTYRSGRRAGEVFEQWYFEDALHREGGPASRMIGPDGKPFIETYYRNDARHRVDGPADWRLDSDGTAKESFHLDRQAGGYMNLWGLLGVVEREVQADDPRGVETLRTSPGYRDLLDEGADPLKIVTLARSGIASPEGIRSVLIDGAPEEWVRAYEKGQAS